MTRNRCRMLRAGLALATLGFGTACEIGSVSAPPPSCSQPGDRCQLSGGPLGVCERAACPTSESAPCFRCVPQH